MYDRLPPRLATAMLLLFAVFVMPAFAADKTKVVYHVADAEKVRFALGNIRNHIAGVGGPENAEIVLVVHGPALKMFHDLEAANDVRESVAELVRDNVAFAACGNTMRAQGVEDLDGILPGFVRADEGGVVRIAELQSQGYIYIRP